ncbi:MAG: glycosyltransferase [Bacteroidota bacterium]
MADLRSRALSALRAGLVRGGWMRDSVWTVLDQGLFAGSNFAVNVLLARWLVPEAYGAFAVGFMVFLAVVVIHTGLFVEPMLVFGSDRFRSRVGDYIRVLLAGHVRFSLLAGGLMALGALGVAVFGESLALVAALLAFAIGQGIILGMWLLRRACYVVSKPAWAASAGALYLAIVVGGAATLFGLGLLSAPAGVGLMAAGSLASGAFLWRRLRVPLRNPRDAGLAEAARDAHSRYGRWSASTGVLEWAHGAIPFLALPILVGLEASGQLRALVNIAMPGLHAIGALAMMAVPVLVRARVGGHLRRSAFAVGGGLVSLAVIYAVVILGAGRPLIDWLYRGQYEVGTAALVLLAAMPIPAALGNSLVAVLRSGERPEAVFRGRVASAGLAASVGLWLTTLFGVVGALASDVVALFVEAGVLLRELFTKRKAVEVSEAAPGERLRVLVGAFACSPGEGSEPGVGWNTVREMARHHDVWVLTYSAYRARIEAELAVRPVPGLRFVYHTVLGERAVFASGQRERGGFAEQRHYYLWQRTARRVARRLHAEIRFHLAHHVTFAKYWMPSAVAKVGVPFIWGPVGGGESAPRVFYPVMTPTSRFYEQQRDLGRWLLDRSLGVRSTARAADLAFATTVETAERMEAVGARDVQVRSAIGLSDEVIDRLGEVPLAPDGPPRFLMIGRNVAFKGHQFGIEAFAEALGSGDTAMAGAEMWLIGDGPERLSLEALASRLGVAEGVRFLGSISRDAVLDGFAQAHALVHPSLHESGGGVCLEAMAAGRPVLGFALGGTRLHVPEAAGILVTAEHPQMSVSALADAMRTVAADPALRRAMGEAGRATVAEDYRWADKAHQFAAYYSHLVAGSSVRVDDGPLPEAVSLLADEVPV